MDALVNYIGYGGVLDTRPLRGCTYGYMWYFWLMVVTYGCFGCYMHLLLSLLMHILDNKVLLSFADGLLFLVFLQTDPSR